MTKKLRKHLIWMQTTLVLLLFTVDEATARYAEGAFGPTDRNTLECTASVHPPLAVPEECQEDKLAEEDEFVTYVEEKSGDVSSLNQRFNQLWTDHTALGSAHGSSAIQSVGELSKVK